MNTNINRRDPRLMQVIAETRGYDARQAAQCYDEIIYLIQHPEDPSLCSMRRALHDLEQGRR